jgi:hypothetical protein
MAFVVPVCAAAMPGAAVACGGEVYREMDSTTQVVAQAEQALSEGKLAKAAQKAIQAYPALKIVKVGDVPLADRALRIIALASTRADGGISAGGFKGKEGVDRAANLEWSIATLRTLTARRANNPSYQTDLGEALSKVPAHHEEAAKVLGELAAKDLLTTPEGYAALARLRAESGQAEGREEAVKRCLAMTKTPKTCDVPAAVAPPEPSTAPAVASAGQT